MFKWSFKSTSKSIKNSLNFKYREFGIFGSFKGYGRVIRVDNIFNKSKESFGVYKTLQLHFEKNLSWSKIGFKNYENIYNNLDFSEVENNNFFNFSLFNNKKKINK